MYISCTITNNTKVIDLYTALLAIYYLQTVNVKKLFTSQNIPRILSHAPRKILSGSKGYFLFTSFNDRIVQRKVQKWKWLEIQH